MEPSDLQADVRSQDDAAILHLSGELNGSAEAPLNDAYDAVPKARTVILNFGDVQYINSTGIAVIVGVLGRARRDGKSIVACGLMDHYKEIFQITRLADFMNIYPDEASAVGGVTAAAG
jgi:anti-sigma B factor antagonist